MQNKQLEGIFLEMFAVVMILGLLASIAIPHVGEMMSNSRAVSRETEFHNIQAAVTEMLYDSTAGKLKSVGPTADMSRVRTNDEPPLVLSDYLLGKKGGSIRLGCTYGFAADGTILQLVP